MISILNPIDMSPNRSFYTGSHSFACGAECCSPEATTTIHTECFSRRRALRSVDVPSDREGTTSIAIHPSHYAVIPLHLHRPRGPGFPYLLTGIQRTRCQQLSVTVDIHPCREPSLPLARDRQLWLLLWGQFCPWEPSESIDIDHSQDGVASMPV